MADFLDPHTWPPLVIPDDVIEACRQHTKDLKAAVAAKQFAYTTAAQKAMDATKAEAMRHNAAQAAIDLLSQQAQVLAFPVTSASSDVKTYQKYMVDIVEPHYANQDVYVPTAVTPETT